MPRTFVRFMTLLAALAVITSACGAGVSSGLRSWGDGPETAITTQTVRIGRTDNSKQPHTVLASNALVPFDACDAFLDYVTTHAVDLVGPYGLDDPWPWWGGGPWWGRDVVFEEATAAALADDGTGSPQLQYSGTNVQELGVDEPDIVKTDGRRIVVLAEGTMIVADITASEPKVVGRLDVGSLSVQNMFLAGDTVLLFGSAWSTVHPVLEGDVDYAPVYQSPTIQLVEVDIGDAPEIVRTTTIDGQFVSGRMVGDTVRLVLTSGPVGFEWTYPTGSGLKAEREAIERNRQIVLDSTEENWIPYFVTTDADGEVTTEGILFDCDRAGHPEEFSGLNMLSVITIDLRNGLDVVDGTGVLATGNTVYASESNLYVATQNWQAWQWARSGAEDERPDRVTTDIHEFDMSNGRRTDYVATGTVDGYLLNQFSVDEHDGLLRVASTSSPNWWGGGFETDSRVTVLEQRDGALVEIGMVDGLGRTEQIYSVRFMDDIAYVVTFRQTDPLYTIDLSNPAEPQVVGELKILGYSAYLHPLGDGLLLGVGQDATETGRIQGTQVSVFDVSDPADPQRVDQFTLTEGSSSQVEYDHHAFLHWEETGLVMVPVQQWWWSEKSDSVFLGAVGLTVDDDGDLREIRRIAHPGGDDLSWDHRAQIMRSIVIGDNVYTVSMKGIMQSDLDSLAEEAWLPF